MGDANYTRSSRRKKRIWLPLMYADCAMLKDGTEYAAEKDGWRKLSPRKKKYEAKETT